MSASCYFDDRQLKITAVDLDVQGQVSGLDQGGFQSAADEAEKLCPVSNALRGNVEIRVNARWPRGRLSALSGQFQAVTLTAGAPNPQRMIGLSATADSLPTHKSDTRTTVRQQIADG